MSQVPGTGAPETLGDLRGYLHDFVWTVYSVVSLLGSWEGSRVGYYGGSTHPVVLPRSTVSVPRLFYVSGVGSQDPPGPMGSRKRWGDKYVGR